MEKGSLDQIEWELDLLDRAIAEAMVRSRRLADELGIMYSVFRSDGRPCGDCEETGNSDIMELSKATDRCIDAIYSLERRRQELLGMLGK